MDIFIFGISGRMGQAVLNSADAFDNIKVVGGFDTFKADNKFIFNDIKKINVKFDVIIDFSKPEALDTLIEVSQKFNKPVVLCSTGHTESQHKKIDSLCDEVAVFQSQNMSLGINILLELVAKTTKTLQNLADIEIIEKHHNQKVDSPSGTAKMIETEIESELNTKPNFLYGRVGNDTKRKKGDIGVHAVRGGSIVGEHEVLFCLDDEVISISHNALSRKVFANGAINAAFYIKNKTHGLYNMKDLINDN